jgi:hypothetical protein
VFNALPGSEAPLLVLPLDGSGASAFQQLGLISTQLFHKALNLTPALFEQGGIN